MTFVSLSNAEENSSSLELLWKLLFGLSISILLLDLKEILECSFFDSELQLSSESWVSDLFMVLLYSVYNYIYTVLIVELLSNDQGDH